MEDLTTFSTMSSGEYFPSLEMVATVSLTSPTPYSLLPFYLPALITVKVFFKTLITSLFAVGKKLINYTLR
jgi:hypothetical protein